MTCQIDNTSPGGAPGGKLVPMADNEKITKIGAAYSYYVKVVGASFPHLHGTLNLLFLEVIN